MSAHSRMPNECRDGAQSRPLRIGANRYGQEKAGQGGGLNSGPLIGVGRTEPPCQRRLELAALAAPQTSTQLRTMNSKNNCFSPISRGIILE